MPGTPGVPLRLDYEYERAGTCNIFVAVEPRGGYSEVRKVHLVLDNLNTHLRSSFQEVLGKETAASILRRIRFHYTLVHASWPNMAEIEIGILERQRLARCAADQDTLTSEIAAWQRRRNAAQCGIERTFTCRDVDRTLRRHYGP